MNKIIKIIGICIILLLVTAFIIFLVLVGIDAVTSKYQYSIDVPCYDRFGNEIYNLTCKEDIYCGVVFNNVVKNRDVYSCDEDKGFLFTQKDDAKGRKADE